MCVYVNQSTVHPSLVATALFPFLIIRSSFKLLNVFSGVFNEKRKCLVLDKESVIHIYAFHFKTITASVYRCPKLSHKTMLGNVHLSGRYLSVITSTEWNNWKAQRRLKKRIFSLYSDGLERLLLDISRIERNYAKLITFSEKSYLFFLYSAFMYFFK